MNWLPVLFWTVLGFLLGALPFSVWLGRLRVHADIRGYGDGNPGAANAWRAGSWRVGLPALVLDYLKGALPVGIAHALGVMSAAGGVWGWGLVPVALAPVAGHAWSPFLGFRGGKAVTVTFGIWSGLTLWEGPTLLGLFLVLFYGIQEADGWSVILGLVAFLGYVLLRHGDPITLCIWAANLAILLWTHRRELRTPPRLRPWLARRLGRPR
jgi:acyl phosphate:glycerol-3-phosphate acyltransferase